MTVSKPFPRGYPYHRHNPSYALVIDILHLVQMYIPCHRLATPDPMVSIHPPLARMSLNFVAQVVLHRGEPSDQISQTNLPMVSGINSTTMASSERPGALAEIRTLKLLVTNIFHGVHSSSDDLEAILALLLVVDLVSIEVRLPGVRLSSLSLAFLARRSPTVSVSSGFFWDV